MSQNITEGIPIRLKPLAPETMDLPPGEFPRDIGVAFLPVTRFIQEDPRSWCYAACAQMVFNFYKKTVKQCDVAGFVKQVTCCPPGLPVCTADGCSHSDIARIYTKWDVLSTPHLQPGGPISWDEMKAEIGSGRPVEVVLKLKGFEDSFHAVIIVGFNEHSKQVMYHDPDERFEPGRVISFEDLKDSPTHSWDSTWTGLTKKP